MNIFLELENPILAQNGQILGNLGTLLLNVSYHHIKIILTNWLWSYVELKRTDNIGVPTLKKEPMCAIPTFIKQKPLINTFTASLSHQVKHNSVL